MRSQIETIDRFVAGERIAAYSNGLKLLAALSKFPAAVESRVIPDFARLNGTGLVLSPGSMDKVEELTCRESRIECQKYCTDNWKASNNS
jgi:hypothetical protein